MKPPIVRIGILTGVPRTSLGSDSGVLVTERGSGAKARSTRVPRATFRPTLSANGPRLRLLETGEEFELALIVPQAPDESFAADASPYRGVFEVRAESERELTLVNVVNLEDYLRGVVPNELSPTVFPEMEALKAQAVAARTYALRNLGQWKARGYDLCATAACQVYRGRSTEHPLTDQAVADTSGITATYRGELINALYTSTCGGHTEDGLNVFEGEPQPYLRGVMCAPEKESWGSLRTTLPREALGPEEGLNRDVALLKALGVVEAGAASVKWLRAIASESDARAWTTRLQAALRRKGCTSSVEPPLARRASFFHHVVSALCWDERARRLLAPEDPDYLLQVEDKEGLSGLAERLAAALLLHEGALSPGADNTLRPNAVITRAEALQVLAGVARRIGPPALRAVAFRSISDGRLVVEEGDGELPFAVAPAVALFRTLDGRAAAVSEVALAPGDRLQVVAHEGRAVYVEVEQPRLGLASDRGSRYYRWEMRLTPDEVAKSIARYGNVGEVLDVIVRRLGVSGRVVLVAVRGTKGELLLRGLKIRWALGLRENLFVIDREQGGGGDGVARFVFTGKGWGHGVGLCQVGAYGMAQAGATFEQILKHYYSGVSLERLPD